MCRSKCPSLLKISKKLPILILTTVGLLWQMEQISDTYFKYDVTTEIQIKIPDELPPVSLSICPFYPWLLNQTEMSEIFKQKNITIANRLPDLVHVEKLVTVSQIFNMTPSEQLLQPYKCQYRIIDSYLTQTTDCNKMFRVEKFMKKQYICYRFIMTHGHEKDDSNKSGHVEKGHQESLVRYSYSKIQSAVSKPNLFFSIFPNFTLLKNVTFFEGSVFWSDMKPWPSEIYPVIYGVKRGYDLHDHRESFSSSSQKRRVKDQFSYSFSYTMIENYLLPSPYVTNCYDWFSNTQYESIEEAIETCVTKSVIQRLNRVAQTSLIYDQNLNYLSISRDDLKNKTFTGILNEIETTCRSSFSKSDCLDLKMTTELIQVEDTIETEFKLFIPTGPSLMTVYSPKLNFIEYLIYLMNSFQFWFGFSLFGLRNFLKSC